MIGCPAAVTGSRSRSWVPWVSFSSWADEQVCGDRPRQGSDTFSSLFTVVTRSVIFLWVNKQVVTVIWQKGHIAARLRRCSPPCNTFPWAHVSPYLNGLSIGSAIYAQLMAEGPYTLQWADPFPSKFPLCIGDLDPHLIHGFMGPPGLHPKQHIDRFSGFCLAPNLDGQTDRPCYFCNSKPHLHTSTAA